MKYCPKCASILRIKLIDQKDRLCCSDTACGYIYWNNPIPVVAIIVETKEGIVLAHNKLSPKGIFSIITGFIEAIETPESAAQRETKEELGLDSITTSFIGVYPFARANQLLIVYHIFAQGKIELNDELDEFKIIQKDELLGWKENQRFEVDEWLKKMRVLA
jgi:NAD+ diphosphatase